VRYPHTEQPGWIEDETQIRDWVEYTVMSLKMDSSPGYPLRELASTNGELIDRFGFDTVVDMCISFVNVFMEWDGCGSVEDLLVAGLLPVFHMFVKVEPVDRERKLLEKFKPRLIWGDALPFQVLTRMLCSTQNNTEIRNWRSIPSKSGIGFTKEMCMDTLKSVQHLREPMSGDVSGFDFSWRGIDFRKEAVDRVMLVKNPSPLFAGSMIKLFWLFSWKGMVLSDGSMYLQTHPCVQPSGGYVTSSSNSRKSVRDSYMVQLPDWDSYVREALLRLEFSKTEVIGCIAQGDDRVESRANNAKERYAQLGQKLKFYERFSTHPEFCSMIYRENEFTPVNLAKNIYSFLGGAPTFERVYALASMYAGTPHHEQVFQIIWEALNSSGGGGEDTRVTSLSTTNNASAQEIQEGQCA